MKKRFSYPLIAVGLLVGAVWILIASARVTRPPSLPDDSPITYPWGSMHQNADGTESESGLEASIVQSIKDEAPGAFDPDHDGVSEYSILVLSGGGSAGAFGAGLLNGWTKAGTRPDFKIVTGVSTGALQATFAFLGSDYDEKLTEVFTEFGTEHIYTQRNIIGALFGDAAFDTTPLADLIEHYITPEVLEAVARKHASGHRLFMGTSNLDTGEFIIWDMGAIASSNQPNKLRRYRRVLLASASIPVLFPPVYIDVDVAGKTYHQMHMDGGSHSQLFLRGFMLDFHDSLEDTGVQRKSETSIYVIRNGRAATEGKRHPVEASSLSIATATINGAFNLSAESSLFRVYMLASRYNIDFNLASIPADRFDGLDPIVFDLDIMRDLYSYASDQAERGYDWSKAPTGLDPDELVKPTTEAPSE